MLPARTTPTPTISRRAHLLLLLLCAGLIALAGGCKSAKKKRSGMEGYNDLIRQQQQAMAVEQMQHPSVYFRGAVQRQVVSWRENLTLAEAILEAGYSNPLSPRSIRVTRGGRVYTIDIRRLMRGTENPPLEPGDLVEVIR